MKNKITVIASIRNREPWRIRTMVESIRQTGASPSIHIVDYGSTSEYAVEYEALCKELKVKYTHMYTEGLPWIRAHPLNFGARTAKTPFIVTTDIDMLYEGNAFQWCLDNYKDKTIFHISTFWLPKNGNRNQALSAGNGSLGVFTFVSKNAFEEINGYDERIQFWGYEDLDLDTRLIKCGYKQIWLPTEYKIYHQWHKVSELGGLRPATVNYNSLNYCMQNKISPKLKNDYGQNVTKQNRPILKYLENEQPAIFTLNHNEITNWNKNSEFIDFILRNKFVKVELGKRFKVTPLKQIQPLTKKIISPIAKICGFHIAPIINYNIDYLYETILSIYPSILKDYYIDSHFESIFFLLR